MANTDHSLHIGIVGMSPEGAAGCYRAISRLITEIERTDAHPTLTMHNHPFAEYLAALDAGDWTRVSALLISSARSLAKAGAQFCVLPDNTAHHVLAMVEDESPIPFLNMVELVAEATASARCRTLGLIGTSYVTNGSTYQTSLGLRGIHLLVPSTDDASELDEIIFGVAAGGMLSPESRNRITKIIERLKSRGCDALILASSEVTESLIGDCAGLRVFDPVELLAEHAVKHALTPAQTV